MNLYRQLHPHDISAGPRLSALRFKVAVSSRKVRFDHFFSWFRRHLKTFEAVGTIWQVFCLVYINGVYYRAQ